MGKIFKHDNYEIRIIVRDLINLRNQLIQEDKYTDTMDELLIKLL